MCREAAHFHNKTASYRKPTGLTYRRGPCSSSFREHGQEPTDASHNHSLRRARRVMGAIVFSGALALATGCHSNSASSQTNAGPDPADANMASANSQPQVMGQNVAYTPQQQGEAYPHSIRSRLLRRSSRAIRSSRVITSSSLLIRRWPVKKRWTSPHSHLRRYPTTTSRRPRDRLHVEARLLGVGTVRLLLGSRHVDPAHRIWRALDAGVLGLVQRLLSVPSRLLGTSRWLLRRH